MKKGRLNKEEVEFIRANRTLGVASLAEQLDRSEKAVEKVLEGLPVIDVTSLNEEQAEKLYSELKEKLGKQDVSPPTPAPFVPQMPKASDMFGHTTDGKKVGGICYATQGSSQWGDEHRESSGVKDKYKSSISPVK